MFNLDRWREILDTLWRSKLRSTLTAFSVAWGIFMLVFLLGMGNGLQNGVESEFADDATNSVWLFSGTTSEPHAGMPIGRKVIFANRDVPAVQSLKGVEKITGRFFVGGNRFNNAMVARVGDKVQSYDVRAVHPDHLYLEKTIMKLGRFLDPSDLAERRKVAVIGVPVSEFLFGKGVNPVGKWIELNSVQFLVVGTFVDIGEQDEAEKIYIPINTAQATFNGADRVNMIMFTIDPDASVADSIKLADQAKAQLAAAHHFSPDDPQAIRVRNNVENFASFLKIFQAIRWFIAIMGICSLVAGVIGVSNIMMIVVRERTREIGIRKALGATAATIVTSIVQESVFLTAIAGYLGLVAGVGALALLDHLIPPSGMFAHPEVDLTLALSATGILVAAGAVAGLFPALSAASVNPITALRDD